MGKKVTIKVCLALLLSISMASFSKDATKDKKRWIQAICEKATDKMFVDIQLLLAQADCTLSEFGFQNYAWE